MGGQGRQQQIVSARAVNPTVPVQVLVSAEDGPGEGPPLLSCAFPTTLESQLEGSRMLHGWYEL